ncbi:unnamed protein product [Allacma fusca]|uniref:Uncharacterized protein n=1 Tax=Allacma fusca TaxID=39272 RepID=A0A8J2LUB8_9HEXA|nr:unnamed protein product [Allacma fusca]
MSEFRWILTGDDAHLLVVLPQKYKLFALATYRELFPLKPLFYFLRRLLSRQLPCRGPASSMENLGILWNEVQ